MGQLYSQVRTDDVSSDDIVIVVIGPSGAGKSTFINTVVAQQLLKISRRLEPCTTKVEHVRCTIQFEGCLKNLVFVDTPAFPDPAEGDEFIAGLNVEKKILDWSRQTFGKNIEVTGILYLYKINENRMTQLPLPHYEMFHKLCGEGFHARVLLVTTMWEKLLNQDDGERRKAMLTRHWSEMIDQGSAIVCHDGTKESAWNVVKALTGGNSTDEIEAAEKMRREPGTQGLANKEAGKKREDEEKQNQADRKEEEVRRREEVTRKRAEEVCRREAELKRKEEAAKKEAETRRKEREEAKRKEQDAKKIEEAAKRKADEAMRKAEELSRTEEQIRQKAAQLEQDIERTKKMQSEAQNIAKDALQKHKDLKKMEEDALTKREELKKMEEEVLKKEVEMREWAAQLEEDTARTKQMRFEAQKIVEDALRKREELRKMEEEAHKKDMEMREREDILRQREESLLREADNFRMEKEIEEASKQKQSAAQKGSARKEDNNTLIAGGAFNFAEGDIHINSPGKSIADKGIAKLFSNVATGAFHDSGERFDPPKCHLDSRVVDIQEILEWLDDPESPELVMWLHGTTGTGKSTIAQTIAQLLCEQGRLSGSFFFARGSIVKRDDGRRLVPTLAYQLAKYLPDTRVPIAMAVLNDPAIFNLTLLSQVQNLLINPLWFASNGVSSSESSNASPRLFIIDGLDDCRDADVQCRILQVFAAAVKSMQRHLPQKLLMTSRSELHLLAAFNEYNSAVGCRRDSITVKQLLSSRRS